MSTSWSILSDTGISSTPLGKSRNKSAEMEAGYPTRSMGVFFSPTGHGLLTHMLRHASPSYVKYRSVILSVGRRSRLRTAAEVEGPVVVFQPVAGSIG